MSTTAKIGIAFLLVLVIAGVATADALIREKSLTSQLSLWLEDGGSDSSSSVANTDGGETQTSEPMQEDSSRDAILQVLIKNGFTYQEKEEPSVLRQLLPTEQLPSYTLLHNGDRAGSLTWVKISNTTQTFQALKDSLLQSFSPALQDLRDETVAEPNKPVRSVLTFLDPALSQERMVFVKTGNVLFELHITLGKETVLNPLIEEMTAVVGS